MFDHLTDLIDQLPGRAPPATPEQIRAAETALGRTLPPDYVSFLLSSNGGGESFFFDFHTPGPTVLMIAWISNWKEEALWAGDSFTDFLERTLRGESPSDHERHV